MVWVWMSEWNTLGLKEYEHWWQEGNKVNIIEYFIRTFKPRSFIFIKSMECFSNVATARIDIHTSFPDFRLTASRSLTTVCSSCLLSSACFAPLIYCTSESSISKIVSSLETVFWNIFSMAECNFEIKGIESHRLLVNLYIYNLVLAIFYFLVGVLPEILHWIEIHIWTDTCGRHYLFTCVFVC